MFLSLCLLTLAPAGDFDDHWRDGRAELCGYQYSVTRYGERREGQALTITVTEPFRRSTLVKTDDAQREPSDVADALKLNFVRDFQTGVYDYDTMTSVFSELPGLAPLKVTFSSAEWCGHVFEELRLADDVPQQHLDSYFEGESGTRELALKRDGWYEDALLVRLRGLASAPLEPGEAQRVDFLPAAFHRRLRHEPLGWTSAEVARAPETSTVEVPAGEFQVTEYTLRVADGRVGVFAIEAAWPHRVVRWDWTDANGNGEGCDSGELLGSQRMAYWNQHGNRDEPALSAIGIVPSGAPKKGQW